MQRIIDARRADHRPLAIEMEIRLNLADFQSRRAWNHDNIMKGVMEGWGNQELIKGVEQEIHDRLQDFEQAEKHSCIQAV